MPQLLLLTWTGLPVEESIRMTEDKDKWRKYVRGEWVWPTVVSRTFRERTEQNIEKDVLPMYAAANLGSGEWAAKMRPGDMTPQRDVLHSETDVL